MKKLELHELFMEELKSLYNSEKQILKTLPNLIKLSSSSELKDALSHHLEETEEQVSRLQQIFSILGVKPTEIRCDGIEGILAEGDQMLANQTKSAVLDAAIIAAAQKVEHYEIASYGTLRSFAKHLELEDEIVDLIQDTLDEEGNADKTLTRIAVGSLFTSGVNRAAADRKARR